MDLSKVILKHLKKEVSQTIKKYGIIPPKLVVFTVQPNEETISFMKKKEKYAQKIGAEFKLISYRRLPKFEEFANKVSFASHNKNTHGIIIQEPLPASLSTVTIFDYIAQEKEIEGFKKKSLYDHPIGLAVMTLLKQVFIQQGTGDIENVIFDMEKDSHIFKNVFKRKKIVLLGKGRTGGGPIGDTLTKGRINYINIGNETNLARSFLEQADVIISAVGKKVVTVDDMKDGVVLISVGIRKENGAWVGDYDEREIKDLALAYSPTPKGVGPLNVSYLMYNLVKAWKLQNNIK